MAELEPELLAPGHGRAFRGEAMRHALHELAVNFESVAIPAHAARPRTTRSAAER
jgi:hypothetical protein